MWGMQEDAAKKIDAALRAHLKKQPPDLILRAA
jgi:hypothetical protein